MPTYDLYMADIAKDATRSNLEMVSYDDLVCAVLVLIYDQTSATDSPQSQSRESLHCITDLSPASQRAELAKI